MYSNLRVEDKLEGANNFRSWKHNGLLSYVKEHIQELEEEEAKTRYKKNMIKARRILLVSHVSELKIAKEMFETLTRLHESKSTNRNMMM